MAQLIVNRPDNSQEHLESLLLPLLEAARHGSSDDHNQLLQQLRSYFHVMTLHELSPQLQRKVGNSDMVQQSCIKVIEGIDQFRGTTEGELRNWLRRILTNEVNQVGRDYRAQKRDFRREVPIDGDSRMGLPGAQPADRHKTPRSSAMAEERAEALRAAMARLPEEYQQVIKMRSWQGLTFPQISEALGKSINATEKIWFRAVQRLRAELKNYHDESLS